MSWYKRANNVALIAQDIYTWLIRARSGAADFNSAHNDISQRMGGIDDYPTLSAAIGIAQQRLLQQQGSIYPVQQSLIDHLSTRLSDPSPIPEQNHPDANFPAEPNVVK